MTTAERVRVGVYVCTFKRNEPLRRLLDSIAVSAAGVAEVADIGVVIVDDNADQRAESVVSAFDAAPFALGLHYRTSGKQNISIARNVGLEAVLEFADWVAMTDDDCVVEPVWLSELLRIQRTTGAPAVAGPMKLRFAEDSPSWLLDEPFAELGSLGAIPDGSEIPTGGTNNSLLSCDFLREFEEIRFDPTLGTLGGEDMVFYQQAVAAGLRVVYSAQGVVWGEEGKERSTLRYQLRQSLWLGNTQYVTNIRLGRASRGRLILRGLRQGVRGLQRPFQQLGAREAPQLRYALAQCLMGLGMVVGGFGVEVKHR